MIRIKVDFIIDNEDIAFICKWDQGLVVGLVGYWKGINRVLAGYWLGIPIESPSDTLSKPYQYLNKTRTSPQQASCKINYFLLP
jgi:hypothetical protein